MGTGSNSAPESSMSAARMTVLPLDHLSSEQLFANSASSSAVDMVRVLPEAAANAEPAGNADISARPTAAASAVSLFNNERFIADLLSVRKIGRRNSRELLPPNARKRTLTNHCNRNKTKGVKPLTDLTPFNYGSARLILCAFRVGIVCRAFINSPDSVFYNRNGFFVVMRFKQSQQRFKQYAQFII